MVVVALLLLLLVKYRTIVIPRIDEEDFVLESIEVVGAVVVLDLFRLGGVVVVVIDDVFICISSFTFY